MFSRAPVRLILGFVALSLAASCGRRSVDEHFRKANEYADQSRLQEAIIEYRAAIQADPQRGDIRTKLADAYMRVPDGSAALKEYVRAADLLPNDVTAQIKAGNLLLLASSFEDAKARARKALALDSKNSNAQILLGNAMAGLKDLDGAVAEYQEAIALNPAQDTAYVNIGAVQFVRGQRAEAEATFKKAIEATPKSAASRLALANFLWATGRTAEAEQVFKEALALDPSDASANRALGTFYIASNRTSEAEPYFQAIAKKANTPAAAIGLSDYYVFSHRFDEARKILTDLASKDDPHAAAATRLAAIEAAQGNRAVALSKLREVLDKHPKETAPRLLSARLLLIDGKRDEALAEANTIVTQDPNSRAASDAYLVIGGIQASVDRREEAIRAYEEVLKRQPQPLAADLALAGLHLRAGSLDKAETYAQQALAIQPNNPQARSLVVRILLSQKKAAQAAEQLASLRKEFPSSPTVLNLLAAQQLAEGHVDEARAAYAKAAELAPHDLEAAAGLIGLDLKAGRTREAISRVDSELETAPPTASFLILAAKTYAAAGNAQKAEELLQKAIEIEPSRLQAYALLGSLYAAERRLDDAKDRFKQVADRNPQSVSANTMLGILDEAQHRFTEAESHYQKALSIDPHAAVAANNLAWLYVASDRNLDQALQLAQAALQSLPDDPHVSDTLGLPFTHS